MAHVKKAISGFKTLITNLTEAEISARNFPRGTELIATDTGNVFTANNSGVPQLGGGGTGSSNWRKVQLAAPSNLSEDTSGRDSHFHIEINGSVNTVTVSHIAIPTSGVKQFRITNASGVSQTITFSVGAGQFSGVLDSDGDTTDNAFVIADRTTVAFFVDEDGWVQSTVSVDVATQMELDAIAVSKVDKVTGKGLSTEDYSTTEKTKLSGIASGAEVNVQADWNQATNTADDYIKNKPTSMTPTSHTHAQADITNLSTDLAAKQATLVSGTNIKTVNGESLVGSGNVSIAGGSATEYKTYSNADAASVAALDPTDAVAQPTLTDAGGGIVNTSAFASNLGETHAGAKWEEDGTMGAVDTVNKTAKTFPLFSDTANTKPIRAAHIDSNGNQSKRSTVLNLAITQSPLGIISATASADIICAYSIRRLRDGYTGAALRIKRSTDNAQRDLRFNPNGSLNTTDAFTINTSTISESLATFRSGATIYVIAFFDQSGAGRNAEQSTDSSAPLLTSANKVDFNSSKWMRTPTGFTVDYTATTGLTIIGRGKPAGTSPVWGRFFAASDAVINGSANEIVLVRADNTLEATYHPASYATSVRSTGVVMWSATVTNTVVVRAINDLAALHVGGNATPTATTASGMAFPADPAAGAYKITLGGNIQTSVAEFWNGEIDELIVLNKDIGATAIGNWLNV